MKVLVDTDVWSELLRRSPGAPSAHVGLLRQLIAGNQVQLVGPIRQEALCGIRHREQFERVRNALRAYPDRPIGSEIYEVAAEYFNTCRSKGVQGSSADFLLCACSAAWTLPILSKDQDYALYRRHVPFILLNVGGQP